MLPTIINEETIHKLCRMDLASMQAVAEGFIALSDGRTQVPPIMRIDFPSKNGEIDVKTAVVEGWNSFAIKIASGFFENHKLGLPNSSGLMLVFSTITGQCQAILLDQGYLTDVRTGLAGALAARELAPINAVVGVIGSGIQSRYQIKALKLVRDFSELHVYGIDPQGVATYAQEMENELDLHVTVHENPEAVVRACNVLVTTTPARDGYVKAEWLHPGMHITCMGSDAPHKQELDTTIFNKIDTIVCDSRAQCVQLGEISHALQASMISDISEVHELGEILSGKVPGRTSEKQITLCDLTGVGVQDTSIARFVLQQYENLSSIEENHE